MYRVWELLWGATNPVTAAATKDGAAASGGIGGDQLPVPSDPELARAEDESEEHEDEWTLIGAG